MPPTTGNPLIDEALIPHLQCCKVLLQNVGNYGPCKVNEIKAISALVICPQIFLFLKNAVLLGIFYYYDVIIYKKLILRFF